MNCKELVELVTDYLEGKLPPVEAARFEQHLSTCTGCRNYLKQMEQTIHVVGHIRRNTLEPEQWQDLMKIFHDWKER